MTACQLLRDPLTGQLVPRTLRLHSQGSLLPILLLLDFALERMQQQLDQQLEQLAAIMEHLDLNILGDLN